MLFVNICNLYNYYPVVLCKVIKRISDRTIIRCKVETFTSKASVHFVL